MSTRALTSRHSMLLIGLGLLAIVLGVPAKAPAQQGAREAIKIAYTSADAVWAPLFIAKDLGLFEKHGVDAEITFIDSGSRAVQALVAQQIDLAFTAGSAPINANLAGADIKIVLGILNHVTGTVYASKDVKTPADLKGRVAAVSSFGSETDFAVRYSLRKLGLEPEKDVTILQIGNQNARFAAIESGRAHYSTALPPLTRKVKAAGYTILGELPDLIPEAQSAAVATSGRFLKDRDAALRRFILAYAEGVHVYKTDAAASQRVLSKWLKVTDAEMLQDAWQYYPPLIEGNLLPTLKGIQLLLNDFIRDPKAKSAKPEQFVDTRAVEALEQDGSLAKLRK